MNKGELAGLAGANPVSRFVRGYSSWGVFPLIPGRSVGIGLPGGYVEKPSHHYVIPRVAEESEMPDLDSISGFSDSSATLGMT